MSNLTTKIVRKVTGPRSVDSILTEINSAISELAEVNLTQQAAADSLRQQAAAAQNEADRADRVASKLKALTA